MPKAVHSFFAVIEPFSTVSARNLSSPSVRRSLRKARLSLTVHASGTRIQLSITVPKNSTHFECLLWSVESSSTAPSRASSYIDHSSCLKSSVLASSSCGSSWGGAGSWAESSASERRLTISIAGALSGEPLSTPSALAMPGDSVYYNII